MSKVLLYNPPGGLWLRGEGRCEQELDNATAFTVLAPTALCYMGAIFRKSEIDCRIVDCPVEKVSSKDFFEVVDSYKPNLAVLNASVLNLLEDLETAKVLRQKFPEMAQAIVIPYFKTLNVNSLKAELFADIDFIIVDEMEEVAFEITRWLKGEIDLASMRGIVQVDRVGGTLKKGPCAPAIMDLDALPFPARDLVKSNLYLRPDVGRPMATIVDGRGCPSACVYCLAPITTGTKVRKRSPDSVVAEMRECVEKHGIRDFLFRSDAFTIKKSWVFEFCNKVVESGLNVSWAANSKVTHFDDEIGAAMKKAGCFLVEFGIESGSDYSLKMQKKGTTVAQGFAAVAAAKRSGLLVYGTILLGFPWETMDDLKQTERVAHEMGLDFIEVHVVAPYMGTELYDMMKTEGLIESDTVGYDMIRNPVIKGTKHVTREELIEFRKGFLRRFYGRPTYVLKTLGRMRSLSQVTQYGKYGLRLIKNVMT